MAFHFNNLVFEGGGVKGIAYLGALEVFEQEGILDDLARVGGVSVGAVYAILVGLGYSVEERAGLLTQLDGKIFLDDSWGVIRDFERLRTQYGWYKGDSFRQWIGEIIRRKTGDGDITFAATAAIGKARGFRDIYLVGTNLSTSSSEIFSAEHTPDMPIAEAARISMSIPLFFAACRSRAGDVYVDGGVLDNYPVKLFDRKKYLASGHFCETDYYWPINRQLPDQQRPHADYVYNKETLGFRLDSREQIAVFRDQAEPARRPIGDLFDYSRALLRAFAEVQQSQHLHSDDWARTVYIDTLGVRATDFDLADDMKQALVQSGRDGATAYLAWYRKASQTPQTPQTPSG